MVWSIFAKQPWKFGTGFFGQQCGGDSLHSGPHRGSSFEDYLHLLVGLVLIVEILAPVVIVIRGLPVFAGGAAA